DVESLENSLRIDGLQEPILIHETDNGTPEVLDGARRLQACKNLKISEVDCIVKKGLNPEEAGRLSYAKNVERESLTPIEVAKHLKRLKEKFELSHNELVLRGYGSKGTITNKLKLLELPEAVQDHIAAGSLTETHGRALLRLSTEAEQTGMARRFIDHDVSPKRADGFVAQHIKKLNQAKEEKVVEIPEADIPGVYFKDAQEMNELQNNTVHLIVTSPPYGIGMDYEKNFKTVDDLFNNNFPVLEECCRVLVPGGVMALNLGDIQSPKKSGPRELILMMPAYQSILRKHGVFLQDVIIWKKQIPWSKRNQLFTARTKHTSYRIMDNFEYVYIFRKDGDRPFPKEDVVLKSYPSKEEWKSCVSGVWEINAVQNQKEHPSQWPEELPARLIKMFSCETETVLDPFLGSGTTVKVARDLNRNAVGYELRKEYKPTIMGKLGIAEEEKSPAAGNENNKTVSLAEYEKSRKPKAEVFGNTELLKEAFEGKKESEESGDKKIENAA
ncbi:MAG: DNA methyltransferase, partial [Bacteroidota bacterium]